MTLHLRAVACISARFFLFGSTALSGVSLGAQQFTQVTGVLPGPARWSDGVCAADVDLDGDLDLFFANGDGFSTPGTQRQNTLIINRLIEQGPNTYADESVARLGVNLSNSKLPVVGDVNGDGYPDVLFVNAFNTDTPFLYINRGAAQPGFFDMESAARGLTEVLSSAGAAFGDVDSDGDLDLVIADTGSTFLGAPGARPKLYINDGAGFFTDASLQLNAPIKFAQMDVQMVDIDNDWDLDILIVNRAANSGGTHYLLLGDGTGQFTDASSLLPTTSSRVYEAEAADLDGDTDRDLFFLSLSGFREGHVQNQLAETGTLGFTVGALQGGSVDDNEIALFDYDVDGDFDIFVGSLGSRERFYRNDGNLSFVNVNGVIQNVQDSTLDVAVGDLDNDGDYDIVTAQGESGNFTNRLYENSGPSDTLPPRFVATAVGEGTTTAQRRVLARTQDQVMDDGQSYVTVSAFFARVRSLEPVVTLTPTGFQPSSIAVESGTRIRFVNATAVASTLDETSDRAWTLDLPANGAVTRVMVAASSQSVDATGSPNSLQVTVTGSPIVVPALDYGSALHSAVIPAFAPGPTAEVGFVLRAEDYMGNVSWSASDSFRDEDAPGASYCEPATNSTGSQARIVARGSSVLASQSLALEAWSLPQQSFGFFVASMNRDFVPVSQGFLCLGQPIARFSNFIQNSGAAGMVSAGVPFGQLPPSVTFVPGDTWNFSYWFRDANPGLGANFTDAAEVVWQ